MKITCVLCFVFSSFAVAMQSPTSFKGERVNFNEEVVISSSDGRWFFVDAEHLYQIGSEFINDQIIHALKTDRAQLKNGSITIPFTESVFIQLMRMIKGCGWDRASELPLSGLHYWFCLTHDLRCRCSGKFAKLFIYDFFENHNFFLEPHMARYLPAALVIAQQERYWSVLRECLAFNGVPLNAHCIDNFREYLQSVMQKNTPPKAYLNSPLLLVGVSEALEAFSTKKKKILLDCFDQDDISFDEMIGSDSAVVLTRIQPVVIRPKTPPTQEDVFIDLKRFDLLSR